MARVLVGLVCTVLLAACGAPGEPPECVASPESAAAIADGLTVRGASLRNTYAVPLPAGSDLGFKYVVAAEIEGRGLDGKGEIGTWAVGELGAGPTVAVNRDAQDFSNWGPANDGSPLDMARDAVAASDEAYGAELCAAGGSP